MSLAYLDQSQYLWMDKVKETAILRERKARNHHRAKGASRLVSWVAAFLSKGLFISPGEIAVPREQFCLLESEGQGLKTGIPLWGTYIEMNEKCLIDMHRLKVIEPATSPRH